MYYETLQFGSFCGKDNRKELMRLFVKMGEGFTEEEAMRRRALFLQSLLGGSENGFADKSMAVKPCSAVDAYLLFIAITGCLGVKIDRAAARLEALIGRGK